MKRARLLSALVVGAAGLLLLLPVTPAGLGADAPLISLAAIPDQTLDIYPGTIPTKATIVPLTVNPADAEIAIRTSSTDKAEVVIDDEDLIIAPEQAGTMYVKVTAAEPGYASASQTFAVHVIAKTENDYNWSGSAKIGGSGYVTGAVFSPIEEDVLYAMADIGGAYRYDFTRDYWVGLNDDATDHSSAYNPTDNRGPGRGATFVASIVPDPVQTGRVYMAAGGSATNAAIYRSDDYGDHWSRFPIGTSINGNDQSNRSTGPRLAIDPKNNNIVYFASQTAGLWRSVDAGQTFARLSDATDLAVDYRPTFVTIDPNSPVDGDGNSTRIIVGTIGATSNTPPTTDVDPMQQRPYKSLFISNDGGGTFAELAGQPAARPDRRYGGFVAEHPAWDWTGKLVVAYADLDIPLDCTAQVAAASAAQPFRRLEVDRNKQFFLWVDCFDPHEPWDPPSVYDPDLKCPYDPDYKGKDMIVPLMGETNLFTEPEMHHIRMLYAEKVTMVDKWLGHLLDKVRALGLEENTYQLEPPLLEALAAPLTPSMRGVGRIMYRPLFSGRDFTVPTIQMAFRKPAAWSLLMALIQSLHPTTL